MNFVLTEAAVRVCVLGGVKAVTRRKSPDLSTEREADLLAGGDQAYGGPAGSADSCASAGS